MSTTSNNFSLDELHSIMTLQRQEAFDDLAGESNNHNSRGSFGSNNNNNNNSSSSNHKKYDVEADEKEESPEDALMKIIRDPPPTTSSSQSPRHHHQNQPRRRSSSRQKSRRTLSEPFDVLPVDDKGESTAVPKRSSMNEGHPRRRSSSAKRQVRPPTTNRRSGSVRKFKRNSSFDAAENAPDKISTEQKKSSRHSSSGTGPRSASAQRPSIRTVRSEGSADGDLHDSKQGSSMNDSTRGQGRREMMKSQRSRKSIRSRDRSGLNGNEDDLKGKSRREQIRAHSSRNNNGNTSNTPEGGTSEEHNVEDVGVESTKTFEHIWKHDKPIDTENLNPGLSRFLKDSPQTTKLEQPKSDAQSSASLSTAEKSLPSDGVKRKTKLEKIHELQAKCDRYKKEWIEALREKKQAKKEIQANKVEMLSLTKEIETHMSETAILRKKLSESMRQLDETQEEQRKERNDYSNAAKELAQSRIDFAKSLNDARELRTKLDKVESTVADKDRTINELKEDLQTARDKIDDLEVDMRQAEDEILRLEDEMQKLQEELIMFRSAADEDEANGNSTENIRKVKDDIDQKVHEERERRLDQKQKKLDEKIRQFEEEREKSLEKQKEKERELDEQRKLEVEKQQERENERQKMGEEIQQRLQLLEDHNTVLQGKLKSAELDSGVKIKTREDTIERLKKELEDMKQQLSTRDADPEGIVGLQREVETAKAEVAAVQDDLDEAQKHSGILEEEIEDLQVGNADLKSDVDRLQAEVANLKRDSETWKRKSEEWQSKASEWTDKAFLWKEKADQWEKTAKEGNAGGGGGGILNVISTTAPAPAPAAAADPQALFLQAAYEKKKSSMAGTGNSWNMLGGIFHKPSEDVSEANTRANELEEENAKQLELIKNLRSEMVKMSTSYKEQAYGNQLKIQQIQKEKENIEMKNNNLMKELELARKLERVAIGNDGGGSGGNGNGGNDHDNDNVDNNDNNL